MTRNIPSGWTILLLREICQQVQYGFTTSATDTPTGVKFLRITDIVPELINWDNVPYCNLPGNELQKFLLSEGDIVIARTGATTGYAKYIKKPPKAVFASYLVRLKIKPEYDSEFVGHVVQSEAYKEFIHANLSGAAQPNANAQVLTSYPILLPSLSTQRKISTILNAYSNLIENNARRIQILEEMAQAIYREWFVHFRFPGHEGVRMVESEMGEIPEGWQKSNVGSICQEVRRNVLPENVEPETPYFGLEHLPRKSLGLSDWGTAKEVQSTKLIFKKNEILFGKIRPYFHKVGPAPVDGVCSSDTIVIRPLADNLFGLTMMTVFSDDFVAQATQSSQGTKMPRANWDILKKFPVRVPPEKLLLQFDEMIRNIIDLIQNLVLRNRNLRQQRDLLLPRLVSGEMNVSTIDSIVQK